MKEKNVSFRLPKLAPTIVIFAIGNAIVVSYLGVVSFQGSLEAVILQSFSTLNQKIIKDSAYVLLSSDHDERTRYSEFILSTEGVKEINIYDLSYRSVLDQGRRIKDVEFSEEWKSGESAQLVGEYEDYVEILIPIHLGNLIEERIVIEERTLFDGVVATDIDEDVRGGTEIVGYTLLVFDKQVLNPSAETLSIKLFLLLLFCLVACLLVFGIGILKLWRRVKESTSQQERINKELSDANIRSEQALMRNRGLIKALDHANDKDTQYISTELHDSICGRLTSLQRFHEVFLQSQVGDQAQPVTEHIRKSLKEVKATSSVARGIIKRLRVEVTDFLGLEKGIEEILTNWDHSNTSSKYVSDISGDNISKIPQSQHYSVVKIIEEALENASRYSNADNVSVSAEDIQGGVRIKVSDDGEGFSIIDSKKEGHFGLEIMEERAIGIGGELEIRSELGYGTTICINIPVEE